jgi:1,5-anhydro-D-fructose reductase (1,5-anhydro-D-mannitol-forming)
MIRIGVIGIGKISTNNLMPAIQCTNRAQLWSVLSRDINKARQAAKAFNAFSERPAFDSLQEFLADPDLDAVIVASPDKLHVQHSLAAISSGKHVLVEKPMATSVEDADAMVSAARKAGIKLGVAYHMRWHQGHRTLARQVWNGEYGDVQTVRAQWTFRAPDSRNWRAHDALGRWWSLAGVGTHCLDWILWMMKPVCGNVEKVESMIGRIDNVSTHDTSAAVNLRFQSGAIAHMFCSAVHDAPRIGEIYGSSGYALCTDTIGVTGSGEIQTHAGRLEFPEVDPYVGEIEDFVSAIIDDRDPEVSGETGRYNIELLTRICP